MGGEGNIRGAFEGIGEDPGDLSEETVEGLATIGRQAKGADTSKWVNRDARGVLYGRALDAVRGEFKDQQVIYGGGFEEMMEGTEGLTGGVGGAWDMVGDWYKAAGTMSQEDLYQKLKRGRGAPYAGMNAEERTTMFRTLASNALTAGIGGALLIGEKRMKMLKGFGKGKGSTYEKTRRMLVGLGFVKPGFGKGKGKEREALEAAMSTTPDPEKMQQYLVEDLGSEAGTVAGKVGGGIVAGEYEELAEIGRELAPEVRAGTKMSGLGGVVAAGKALADAWNLEALEIRKRVEKLEGK
jgi:hypothetical protein